jgi:hypothetical protein
MPVPRRTAKVRLNAPEIDDQTWGILTDQLTVDDLPETWDGRLMAIFADVLPPPNLHTAWDAHADQIVAAWATNHPGTRPSCWWRWNAPGTRNIVAEPEPSPDADPGLSVNTRELVTCSIEAEATFLDRHGLFLDGEVELLTPDAFLPEEVTKARLAWTCPGSHGVPRRPDALRRLRAA